MVDDVGGNIILFGETGSGKSSIINMIAGHNVAKTRSQGASDIFEHTSYHLQIHGRTYQVFDTAGMDEGDDGAVIRKAAVAQLYKLIVGLDGGVSLLIFCMRGPRIKGALHRNWNLFHEIIFKKEVPISLVVTGLENEENMSAWWWDNKETFENQGIFPAGRACITAIRGRALKYGNHAFDKQYEESRATMMNLIANEARNRALIVDKISWFYEITQSFLYIFRRTKKCEAKEIQEIADMCGMSKDEAREFARQLAKCE